MRLCAGKSEDYDRVMLFGLFQHLSAPGVIFVPLHQVIIVPLGHPVARAIDITAPFAATNLDDLEETCH